nr:chloramphenicol acetyltransferase [uncultured Chryseobacterium sp.]
MKTLIKISTWDRKEQYLFFSQFEEPFFGITVSIDCTKAYAAAKENNQSFFLYYLYRAIKAVNSVENFRYRIIDGNPYLYDVIHASATVGRPDNTFGFSYIDYYPDESVFRKTATTEIERVRLSTNLLPAKAGDNVIHFSAVPWLNFTSVSHARRFSSDDSCPKISFAKMVDVEGIKTMNISIHGHHALMDGYHVGLFTEKFQMLMNEE